MIDQNIYDLYYNASSRGDFRRKMNLLILGNHICPQQPIMHCHVKFCPIKWIKDKEYDNNHCTTEYIKKISDRYENMHSISSDVYSGIQEDELNGFDFD